MPTSPSDQPAGAGASEIAAIEKHACPACGAQAVWNPGRQRLICEFCGTEAPYAVNRETGVVQEIDLVRTLRELPDELRGWQAERRSVQCQSCKAVMVFDPARVGQNCEFCGSPALVDYREIKAPIRPQSLLPFRISQSQVRDSIRRWFTSRWFAPNRLKRSALIDTVGSVYVPYWTFDAQARCPWRAEAGYYYYTTEQHRDRDGKWQTRRVRHVRWEPASGQIEHFFDDEPVPGTKGVDLGLLRGVEPFPTKELVSYDTAYLSGHVVEHYQTVLVDAARQSQEAMHAKLERMCASKVPGDTQRNLEIFPEYSGRTFKHILVPVWLLTYNLGAKTYQVLVNGYTGTIAGRYPKSVWKLLLLALAILVAIGMIIWIAE